MYRPTAGSLSQQTARFAAAERNCLRDTAQRLGMSTAQLNRRLLASYVSHAAGAIHSRDLGLARQLMSGIIQDRGFRATVWPAARGQPSPDAAGPAPPPHE